MHKELRRYICPYCGHVFERALQITTRLNARATKNSKKSCGSSTIVCPECDNFLPSIEGSEFIKNLDENENS